MKKNLVLINAFFELLISFSKNIIKTNKNGITTFLNGWNKGVFAINMQGFLKLFFPKTTNLSKRILKLFVAFGLSYIWEW